MQKQTIGMIQVILAAVCWGSLGFLGTLLNRAGFAGMQVATLRIVLAVALLLLALPYFLPKLRQCQPRQIPMLMIQSWIGMLGMSLLYFWAVARVGSALAVALLYTAPIWSLIFGRLLLGESITHRSAILTVVAGVGVGLSMAGASTFDGLGIIIGLGSGVCYALYGVLGKRAMVGADPMMVLFTSVAFSALALLLLPTTYATFGQFFAQGADVWLTAIALSLVGTIVAFGLFVKGIEKMPVSKASVFTVLEPLTAVLLAVALLGESLVFWQYVGVFLIVLVAILNAKPPKTKT